jgi:hypothetical protein
MECQNGKVEKKTEKARKPEAAGAGLNASSEAVRAAFSHQDHIEFSRQTSQDCGARWLCPSGSVSWISCRPEQLADSTSSPNLKVHQPEANNHASLPNYYYRASNVDNS